MFDADRQDGYCRPGFVTDFIIHSQLANAKLPWSHWIGPHRFSVSGLDLRLVAQLAIDRVHDDSLLARGEPAQMVLRVRRILYVVGQSISVK